MRLLQMLDEDFVNYRKPSMFIGATTCNWKCCTDLGIDVSTCQNHELKDSMVIDLPDSVIYKRYINNPITSAVVIGGLEPFLQFEEVLNLLVYFRLNNCFDDFVVYTGYSEQEIQKHVDMLKQYENVIVKFGRYVPGKAKVFDETLGVYLSNEEQHAVRIS